MTVNGIGHGTFVPQGWKLEYSGTDATTAWNRSVELARQAETLGYDHLWVYDHVETVPRREPTHMFEAFTMLAALSQLTSTIELGELVTCVGYRNVGLLAKEAACVDVYSGGRFILGIGAGWYSREYEAYGYDYPSNGERLALLDEALTVIPRLWSDETVDFDGVHVQLDGAFCDPKPLRSPRPPILVGGGGEQVTLRIAARHADLTNWQVGLDAFVRKSELLARYCDEVGRDPSSITRTHGPDCRIFDSEADLRHWLDSPGGGQLSGRTGHEEYVRDNLIGTVEQVTGKAQAFVDAGCGAFLNWYRDFPSDESMSAWIEQVAPVLRA
ncbi:MAG TPA: TIGR03560 family F420-dependent LLM class oxidoreductase [Microthrixaceae bacterium]|nr:TIGR03560 family F420-dependent LLM class oxidoreductase [Microthrixaceae bacterium]